MIEIIYDPRDNEDKLLTDEETYAILVECLKLIPDILDNDIGNLVYHDMSFDTKHNILLSGLGRNKVGVSRFTDEHIITETPNVLNID